MALPVVVTSLLFPLLVQAIKWLSPVARDALSDAMRTFYSRALASPSSWDDVAAKILCILLSVDVSDITSPSSGPGTIPADVVDTITSGMIEVATGRPFDPPGNELGGA